MFRIVVPCLFMFMILAAADAVAQDSLSFQGFVTNELDQAEDTTVSMTFKLYKDGTLVGTEVQPAVTVTGGIFNVLLGSVTPLDTVAFNAPMELGITFGGNSESVPRTVLAATAFAKALPGFYTYRADDGENEGVNVVGGHSGNSVADNVVGATISGGGGDDEGVPVPNHVGSRWGTVGGGLKNSATGPWSVVAGGNENEASDNATTVGGGSNNVASNNSATVGGGSSNVASGSNATVAGGSGNTSGGSGTTVGGGSGNTASYFFSTVPGGNGNIARGYSSFAAGHYARANHDGTFVWDDRSVANSSDSLVSTAPNQFLVGALGGVGINTNAPGHPLQVGVGADTLGNGAHVTDGGAWTNGSSRNFKEDFQSVSSDRILDQLANLDIWTWRYRGSQEGRHIGPTAEDFAAAFSTGTDNRYISTVDADGVALSAIQGLYELVLEQQDEIRLQRERILQLEKFVRSLP